MNYKQDFIRFMVDSGVLTFGKFTLKSGRISPYFMNSGNYKTGAQLAKLGSFYAECIHESGVEFETLFGPAYKGIPLSVATATALYNKYGIDANYCFDRKEAKDHGEGGVFVGYTPKQNEDIVIVEDVITAGTAIRESMQILSGLDYAKIAAVFVMVDRKEKGKTEKSAMQEISDEYKFPVYSVVDVYDIIEYLEEDECNRENVERIKKYLEINGAK